jgi:hypothetical protein
VLTATPSAVNLTERDDVLRITLKSDGKGPVRYRVALAAPHLSIRATRGTFVGETTLELKVDGKKLIGTESPGIVRVFTTLGDVVVNAPIRVGVSGTYQGAMTYDASALPLGTVGVALALRESNGDVVAEVDAKHSLLFPDTGSGAVTGTGTFRYSDGARFALSQTVENDFGKAQNHFRRRVTRDLTFRVVPDAEGNLVGTFDERINGLMNRPITLKGHLTLERRELAQTARFVPSPPVESGSTAAATPLRLGDVFAGWSAPIPDCEALKNYTAEHSDCAPTANHSLPAGCSVNLALMAFVVNSRNYPLAQRFNGGAVAPIEKTATLCAAELGALPDAIHDPQCAIVPNLACALDAVAGSVARGPELSDGFSSLFAHVLEPALLVAQDDVVRSLKASFTDGPGSELAGLRDARQTLEAPATWVLQPQFLEYLGRIPGVGAAGSAGTTTPLHVDALRKLSRLFFVLSTIDGELSRGAAASPPDDQVSALGDAQTRGVLTLLDAASVIGVLDAWGQSAPADVGTEFSDVLSPMDQGYRALLEGSLTFGVPEGFIPFLHRPGDASSNFEQVLASIQPVLLQFVDDAKTFNDSKRTYELNQDELEKQLLLVQSGFESSIAQICGVSFDVTKVTGEESWAACGKDAAGDLGALQLDIAQANNRLEASQQRILGMKQKIDIEYGRIKEVKEVRDGSVALILSTGDQLAVIDFAEGMIDAAVKALDIASNASLWNAGAPLGEAAAAAVLEMQRATLSASRTRLQAAQEARLQADSALVEVVNGMATVHTMMVDMAQLEVEMQQDVTGVLQAELNAKNAVNRAKRLFSDRAKTLAQAGASPYTDPSFRILQDRSALQAIASRAAAQRGLFLATRALEYELNQPFGTAAGRAVFNAFNADETSRMTNCLKSIATDAAIAKGEPQAYTTELSVRKALGINGTLTDSVTGQVLSEGDQFRRILLKNENLDGHGGAGVAFASDLKANNALWPSNVCDDKITSVEAQIVGDFSGDNDAQVEVSLEGGGVLRRCDRPELVNWSTGARAVVQAGVNSYGTSLTANASLKGMSVASSRFQILIPGKDVAPANADLDMQKVEDVVLRIRHEARPRAQDGQEATPIATHCLDAVGALR